MNKIQLIASVAAGFAATSAAAQTELELLYTGRVVELVDPAGQFADVSLGQAAGGTFVLDLDADAGPDNPNGGGNDDNLGIFEALAFNAAVDDQVFNADPVFASIFNDKPDATGELQDAFTLYGIVAHDEADFVKITGDFTGDTDLFDDSDIGGATRLRLENLNKAEVTIEFSVTDTSGGSNGGQTLTSIVTIELLTLESGGNRVATFVCLPDTNENGEIDFGDFNAWVIHFNNNDYRADINLDGQVTPTDFTAWLNAFNNGC